MCANAHISTAHLSLWLVWLLDWNHVGHNCMYIITTGEAPCAWVFIQQRVRVSAFSPQVFQPQISIMLILKADLQVNVGFNYVNYLRQASACYAMSYGKKASLISLSFLHLKQSFQPELISTQQTHNPFECRELQLGYIESVPLTDIVFLIVGRASPLLGRCSVIFGVQNMKQGLLFVCSFQLSNSCQILFFQREAQQKMRTSSVTSSAIYELKGRME